MKQAVCVTFKVKPAYRDQFLDLVQQNAAASLELEVACLQFDVCHDPDNPTEVFLYEIYGSPEAFGVHLETRHFKEFDRAVSDMVDSKHVKIYRSVN